MCPAPRCVDSWPMDSALAPPPPPHIMQSLPAHLGHQHSRLAGIGPQLQAAVLDGRLPGLAHKLQLVALGINQDCSRPGQQRGGGALANTSLHPLDASNNAAGSTSCSVIQQRSRQHILQCHPGRRHADQGSPAGRGPAGPRRPGTPQVTRHPLSTTHPVGGVLTHLRGAQSLQRAQSRQAARLCCVPPQQWGGPALQPVPCCACAWLQAGQAREERRKGRRC